MEKRYSERGFPYLHHPPYIDGSDAIIRQSSVVGSYSDSLDRPGTSCLWIGSEHHLNREEVAALIGHLQSWLDTGEI